MSLTVRSILMTLLLLAACGKVNDPPTEATFRVEAAGLPVDGDVSYDGRTATFTPDEELPRGTPFSAPAGSTSAPTSGPATRAEGRPARS